MDVEGPCDYLRPDQRLSGCFSKRGVLLQFLLVRDCFHAANIYRSFAPRYFKSGKFARLLHIWARFCHRQFHAAT